MMNDDLVKLREKNESTGDLFCVPAALLHVGCEDNVEGRRLVRLSNCRDSELQSGKHGTSRRLLLRL